MNFLFASTLGLAIAGVLVFAILAVAVVFVLAAQRSSGRSTVVTGPGARLGARTPPPADATRFTPHWKIPPAAATMATQGVSDIGPGVIDDRGTDAPAPSAEARFARLAASHEQAWPQWREMVLGAPGGEAAQPTVPPGDAPSADQVIKGAS